MADNFESEKNVKATGYTAAVLAVLLLIFFTIGWTHPVEPPPPVEDGIEVNLGNSDKGLGKDQPYLPGQPSAEDKEKYTPPKQAVVEKAPAKDVETDDNNKEEAPVIKKAVVTKPNATRIPDKEESKVKARPVKVPETMPAPPKPKPKAVFHGVNGAGTGGNGADDFKPGGNEGIAGGRGDQGAPGGNPNSTNYTGGGHGNSGVSISRGLGRPPYSKHPILHRRLQRKCEGGAGYRPRRRQAATSPAPIYPPRFNHRSIANYDRHRQTQSKIGQIQFRQTPNPSERLSLTLKSTTRLHFPPIFALP